MRGKTEFEKRDKSIQKEVETKNLEISNKIMQEELSNYKQKQAQMKVKYKEAWREQTQIKSGLS